MNTTGTFVIGLAVGAALGIGGMLLLGDETAPAPPPGKENEISHEACRAREEILAAEVELFRARIENPEAVPAPAAEGVPAGTGTPDTPEEPVAAEDAVRAALQEVRAKLEEIRDAEPGSEAVLALIREWRARLEDENERMARLAAGVLKRLAATGKLRPADVEGFAAEYRRLPRGARARPGLAAVVTRAYAQDPRLAEWFRDLPPVEEPEIREQAVWALDESPSDALRDYVLKLSREETSADVLNSIWNEDIILVTLTRETAPKLIEAIKGRVAQGDLPPRVRGRAYFAIGLAATLAPELANGAVVAMLASETDPGVRAFGEGVGKAVEREESNVQALEGLWGRHAKSFGK